MHEFRVLCQGIVGGLAGVHALGWIHGGVNPQNYQLDEEGRAIAVSLGLAMPMNEAGAAGGVVMAVPRYMAPEVGVTRDGAATHSAAADLWSLGVMLFEARYGRHPLARIDLDSPLATIVTALAMDDVEVPASAAHTDSDEEAWIRDWLMTLLRKDPAARPASAVDALRALDGVLLRLDDRPPRARAFVAMPFARQFDVLWREIRLVCAEQRVNVERGDERFSQEDIWGEVSEAIANTDFVIAVCSQDRGQLNPNVMIEVGFARALRKPTLLITDDVDALPFDLRTQRALVYSDAEISQPAFRTKLAELLAALIGRAET